MEYNKSILKIYEFLLSNLGKEIIVEDLIKNTKVGRTAGFESINRLIKIGVAAEKKNGRQREISLKLDRHSLSFKLFLDSFRFKELDNDLKLIVNLFTEYCRNIQGINSLSLFGSAIESKNYGDIDITIAGDKFDKNKVFAVRNKLELVSDKIINIHFSESVSPERFAKSLCIYGFDYCVNSLVGSKARESFIEAVDWLNSYKKNKTGFENLLVNLGFAYCYFNDIFPKTKKEAKSLLLKRYPYLNKNNAKKAVREIGEEIFR